MEYKVELNPEVARLAQARARRLAIPFRPILARAIAEQAVVDLDPEYGLILNTEASLSEIATFARVVGANDIVVNARRFQILPLDENDTVELTNAILVSDFLEAGALVVRQDDTTSGAIVGHLDFASLNALARGTSDLPLRICFKNQPEFDLPATLQAAGQGAVTQTSLVMPKAEDYVKFLKEPGKLSLGQLQSIVAAASREPYVRENLVAAESVSIPVPQVLSSLATWSTRVERLATKLRPRFTAISPQNLAQIIRETGEVYGGQSESPAFRQHLLQRLAKEELASKLAPEYLLKVTKLIELITAGRTAMEGVKTFVSNQMAIDLAGLIADKREQIGDFSKATVEEIGYAFQSLRVQPAYATHSSSPESIIEDINQALVLVEASTWVYELSEDF